MKRLIKENFNTAEEYNKKYFQYQIDEFDLKRWKKLLKYYKGGKLVDIGCLNSFCSIWAKDKYPKSEILGIDIADKAIQDLQKNYPEINWLVKDCYNTDFRDNHFDYIIAGELIEHLERPKQFIGEAYRILKPNGILAFSTPLNEAIEPGAVDLRHHLWSFDKQDIKNLLKNFKEVKIKIMDSRWFPYYKYHFKNIIVYAKK